MSESVNEVQPIHWALKILLTTLIGGFVAISALFLPPDALAMIPQTIVWTLYLVVLVLSTTIFAVVLYLRERCPGSRSFMMGMGVGVIASIMTTMAGSLVGILGNWLFSMIRLG